jgi:SHS family lactate transporter-like MFS transporter
VNIVTGGYEWGYILAAVVNIGLVPKTSHTWRTLFWTSAGISAFAAFIRALLPESEFFLRARAAARASGTPTKSKSAVFFHEAGVMLKHHWRRAIYVVLLMTGLFDSFASHI